MTGVAHRAYREARDLLLESYGDHDAAAARFAWPELGEYFNWAVDWFDAVAEGNDPPAAAVVEFQNQVTNRQIKVLVYNNQTVTAVTTHIKQLAESNKIPLVGVSETLQPLTATFQDWQLSQLRQLETALSLQS